MTEALHLFFVFISIMTLMIAPVFMFIIIPIWFGIAYSDGSFNHEDRNQ